MSLICLIAEANRSQSNNLSSIGFDYWTFDWLQQEPIMAVMLGTSWWQKSTDLQTTEWNNCFVGFIRPQSATKLLRQRGKTVHTTPPFPPLKNGVFVFQRWQAFIQNTEINLKLGSLNSSTTLQGGDIRGKGNLYFPFLS